MSYFQLLLTSEPTSKMVASHFVLIVVLPGLNTLFTLTFGKIVYYKYREDNLAGNSKCTFLAFVLNGHCSINSDVVVDFLYAFQYSTDEISMHITVSQCHECKSSQNIQKFRVCNNNKMMIIIMSSRVVVQYLFHEIYQNH